MMKSIACALALAASLPAAATAESVERSETVRFDDLNLASPAGVMALERRITGAARRVCGYHEARQMSLITPKDVTACMNSALASARQQVALKTGTAILRG